VCYHLAFSICGSACAHFGGFHHPGGGIGQLLGSGQESFLFRSIWQNLEGGQKVKARSEGRRREKKEMLELIITILMLYIENTRPKHKFYFVL
jgi:hypothetical protein